MNHFRRILVPHDLSDAATDALRFASDIGSVAEKVVRHSPIPVLTLRTGRTRAATRPARAA